MYMYMSMYKIYIYIYLFICLFMYVHIHVYIHTYIHTCVYTHIMYTHVYIYIYIEREREIHTYAQSVAKVASSYEKATVYAKAAKVKTMVVGLASRDVQVLLSFQQPTFHKFTKRNSNDCSAAWSAFHLKHVIVLCVFKSKLKCRLLR